MDVERTDPEAALASVERKKRGPASAEAAEWHLTWAMRLSWIVNWLLLFLKIYAYIISRSKAVLASMADSAVDLASQLVLAVAEHKKNRYDPRYPVGRARLEAIAVILCACIMTLASVEVIQFAGIDLYDGLHHSSIPELNLSPVMFAILAGGTGLKLLLFLYCWWLGDYSDSIKALGEDHINDVASNAGAIVAAIITKYKPAAWWMDPVAAIVISLVIAGRWIHITYQQIVKLVGRAAPEDFQQRILALATDHHPELSVDATRVYHFGARYMVELEVIMPRDTTIDKAHDVAIELQHKVEALDLVERAFVHIDYESRNVPEHKVERGLLQKHAERQAARGKSGTSQPSASSQDASGKGDASGSAKVE